MSDDASAPATAPVEQTEQPAAPTSGDAPATEPATESTQASAPTEEATKPPAQDGPVPQTNGASTTKNGKRKSVGGVPEHKNKKLNRKQSKIDLNLDIKPGELWLAVMKGYKNWPCIICDEEMLPESLLSKRPVSAMRPDGSYRPDFDTGGKNARDRRYPIMFLGTNEFAWHVNTDLRAITPEDCKKTLEENEKSNKKPLQPKSLHSAFEVASEGHDLAYFKSMLAEHEEQAIAAQQAWEEEERKAAEAEAKKDEDTEMVDADSEKPKKEKKRKAPKDEELGEDGKPLKTPKKIKIKPPQEKETPAADSATKPKKEKKRKEEKVAPAAEAPKPVPQETPEEAHEKMQKTILFLRHRLQKGFLSRDKPPEESEMPGMNTHMKTLENYSDLDGSIIKTTKINKVLKAIIKLHTIPRDSEFHFKDRSQAILSSWGKQLDESAATPAVATPTANGVKEDEKEKPVESTATPAETPAPTTEAPKKDDTPVDTSEPAAEEKKPEEPAAVAEATTA